MSIADCLTLGPVLSYKDTDIRRLKESAQSNAKGLVQPNALARRPQRVRMEVPIMVIRGLARRTAARIAK